MATDKYRVPVILGDLGEPAKAMADSLGISLSEYIRRLILADQVRKEQPYRKPKRIYRIRKND